MIKRDFKVSSPSWDCSEDQMLLDIEKTLSAAALDAGNFQDVFIRYIFRFDKF